LPSFDDVLQKLGLEAGVPDAVAPAGTNLFGPEPAPDEPTDSASFSVVNGVSLDVRLGFVVGSVIIDNNTSAFMNAPDATKDGTGRWVGPGQPGAFPILGHISRARINWSAPPGKSQPAPVPTEAAQVTFFAAAVPPGFGSAAPGGTTRGVAFPSLSRANGVYTFDVPAQSFARGIIVYMAVTGGAGTVTLDLRQADLTLNVIGGPQVTSNAIPVGSGVIISIYPGITPLANFNASVVLGQSPRITVTVAGGPATFAVEYDLAP